MFHEGRMQDIGLALESAFSACIGSWLSWDRVAESADMNGRHEPSVDGPQERTPHNHRRNWSLWIGSTQLLERRLQGAL